MTPTEKELGDAFGFYRVSTGGGCEALVCQLGELVYVVTGDDACVPETAEGHHTLGIYTPECWEQGYAPDRQFARLTLSQVVREVGRHAYHYLQTKR